MFKPIIGIDVDGVIADSDKIFRKYINKEFGFNLKRSEMKNFFYEKVLNIPVSKMQKFWEKFTKENWWNEIPLLPNAKTSIDYLKAKYNIIIITARPVEVQQLTIEWLNRNEIYYDDIIFIIEKNNESKVKKILEKNINLKYHIEDRLDFAIEFIKEKIKIILFDYPWNREVPKKYKNEYLIRVKGWREALSYL